MTNQSSNANEVAPEPAPESLSARPSQGVSSWTYYLLFFISGFPALLYQIVWERALFTIYGVNVESVTIIVTIFMLGLGLGSLAGGRLSLRPSVHLLRAFGSIELAIGVFGAVSLWIFHRVAAFTAGASLLATGLTTFLLLLIPTLLMGSTLPLLVKHFVGRTGNVGESVASLYSVNALGSGAACLAAALFLMRSLGESGTVTVAALLNTLVGMTALVLSTQNRGPARISSLSENNSAFEPRKTIPLRLGVFLAAAVGFISLAYEIIWYRLYSFTSGGAAPCFPKLLAFYLFGIGYGSFAVRDICRRELRNNLPRTLETASTTVIAGSIVGFLLGPLLSFSVRFLSYDATYPFVFVAAALLGAAFPLLSQAAIGPRQDAGGKLGYLYLGNIAGSALGSFLIGFVIIDHWSTRATSLFLLGLGATIATVLAALASAKGTDACRQSTHVRRVITIGCAACVTLALLSEPLFSRMYERLLFKDAYVGNTKFADLVENRSGVIAVGADETVFGGGVYDGRFNVDLLNDTNGIFRAYAIAGLQKAPKQVLVIGLSSGSWAQIVANHPEVQAVTIVEINPGYLGLIRQRASVSSLLHNPKVTIVIDDGRRWLVRNPDRKFDFILMNTSYHWRANVSNLLSREFCALLRDHLNRNGIAYYNTTWSGDAQATGTREFPYALRIANFLAVSDSPFVLDKDLWRMALTKYKLDGHPVFDLTRSKDQARLDEVLRLADPPREQPRSQGTEIETRAELLKRWKGHRTITDDNMGTEWQ